MCAEIYEWGTDPLFSSFRKMLVWSIFNQVQTVIHPSFNTISYFYYQRPIQKVEITGVITSIERSRKRNIVIVDDGTGSIRCIKYISFENTNTSDLYLNSIDHLNLGDLVTVKGALEKLETNYADYQLMLRIMIIEKQESPNIETLHYLSTMHLTKNVYSQPL